MKKSHLDKNNTIKFLIYFFSFFIFISIFLSFLYKGKVSDFYVYVYDKFFISQNSISILSEENNNLKNELQNLKNVISEKNISDTEVSSGLVDNIKAKKISYSFFGKDIMYSEIILNKGSLSGVVEGSKVYIAGFKPVGIISEVSENTSKLKLYSYDNFENEFILKFKKENLKNILEIPEILSTSTEASTNTESKTIISNSDNYEQSKDYIFSGTGDGAYGIKIKVPNSFSLDDKINIYIKEDSINPVATVVSIKEVISQKEKEVYLKTYYNSSDYTDFYIVN